VLPLAPDLEPVLDGGRARVPLAGGGALELALPANARWQLEPLDYYPEFGLRLVRRALVGTGDAGAGAFELRVRLSG